VYNFRIVTRGFYSEKDAAAAVKQTLIAVQVNITVDRFVYIYI
jgi:peptidoglycan biosynthesis protein MviN/MurJ (putative lipid II flippase)